MRNMFKSLAAGLAAVFLAAPAFALPVTIDFESFPGGGVPHNNVDVDTQYASLGVTFELFENGASVGPAALNNDYTSSFALFNLVSGTTISDANRADLLRMTFAGPVGSLSFLHAGWGDYTRFEAYDQSGTLLETLSGNGGSAFQTVSFSATGIARLDVFQSQDNYAYAIDNLTFDAGNTAAVPLPATAPLFAGALLMLGAARRKSRRKA
ncbi:hypothetical protein [Tropicimonas sp.]|uniref:hypothetical protein n=1 Tax=Tropicimonas sp. TaxID=2067044 RepID=UPI003A84DBC3